jgi:excinuclease UvrABC helicase subunit UvrB
MLLSSDQQNAIDRIKEFISSPEKLFILNGSAGTGKTSIINNVFENDIKLKKYVSRQPPIKQWES